MFLAGYHALLIKGRSECPVRVTIGPRIIHIKKTDPLYGTGTEQCLRELYDLEESPGLRSLAVIGQGGEKTVRFADIVVDRYWRFGGAGAGAVFGSKNLKALIIYGDRNLPIPDYNVAGYREAYEDIHEQLVHSELMPILHGLGTAANLEKTLTGLPGHYPTLMDRELKPSLTARSLADKHLVRQLSCTGCPIGCIHVGQYRRMFGRDSLEYEESHLPYDYASVFALGSGLGMETADDYWALWEKAYGYGLDPLSTGAALGWLTGAYAQGLVSEKDTGKPIRFGYVEGYLHALDGLVGGETDLYRDLALGATTAAARWGGKENVTEIGSRADSGLHAGYAGLLNLALGFRPQDFASPVPTPRADAEPGHLVSNLIAEEAAHCLRDSLGICRLVGRVYDFRNLSRAMKMLGFKLSPRQLKVRAYDLFQNRQALNRELGFDPAAVEIPTRFFDIPTTQGRLEPQVLKEMLDLFALQTTGAEKEALIHG